MGTGYENVPKLYCGNGCIILDIFFKSLNFTSNTRVLWFVNYTLIGGGAGDLRSYGGGRDPYLIYTKSLQFQGILHSRCCRGRVLRWRRGSWACVRGRRHNFPIVRSLSDALRRPLFSQFQDIPQSMEVTGRETTKGPITLTAAQQQPRIRKQKRHICYGKRLLERK